MVIKLDLGCEEDEGESLELPFYFLSAGFSINISVAKGLS